MTWLVVGCGQNPEYNAQLGVFDLRYDPADYLDMSVEQLIEVMNGRAKAIRCVKANAQPILLPRALASSDLHDLGIDNNEIERRAQLILETDDFQPRVGKAISNRFAPEEPSAYVEEHIYDGFLSRTDELLMQRFHQVPWEQRGEILDQIGDQRIRELGYRLIYIERPSALPAEKREGLDTWLCQRLKPNIEVPWLSVAGALDDVEKLHKEDPENRELFSEVGEWLRILTP